jgi:hypothetical protein
MTNDYPAQLEFEKAERKALEHAQNLENIDKSLRPGPFKALRFSPLERAELQQKEFGRDGGIFQKNTTNTHFPREIDGPQLWPAGRRGFLRGGGHIPGRHGARLWDNTGGVLLGLNLIEYQVCRAALHGLDLVNGQARKRYSSLSLGIHRTRRMARSGCGDQGWLFPWAAPFGTGAVKRGRPEGGRRKLALAEMSSYWNVQSLLATTAIGLFERLVQPPWGVLSPMVGEGTADPFRTLRCLYDFGWLVWLVEACPDWCEYAKAAPALGHCPETWDRDVSRLFNGDRGGEGHPLDPRRDTLDKLRDQDPRGAAFFGACYAAASVLLWPSMACRWAGRRLPQLEVLYRNLAPLPAWLEYAMDDLDMAQDCKDRLDRVLRDRT